MIPPTEMLYRKEGRKYVPYGTPDLIFPYTIGFHLVQVKQDCTSIYRNVPPDRAAVEAGIRECEDAMVDARRERSAPKPARPPTDKEKEAWAAYCAVMGEDSTLMLTRESAFGVVCAALAVLRKKMAETEATR